MTYSITFNRDGGSGGTASTSATYNAAMPSISAPSRTGYTFLGYFTSKNGGGTKYYSSSGSPSKTVMDNPNGIANNSKSSPSLTLYASWRANTVTVTFNNNGHGGTAPASQTVQYGNTITNPGSMTDTAYDFGGWCTNSACTSAFNFSSGVTSNQTLYAKWTIKTYKVTFKANGHGSDPAIKTVNHGSKVTKPSLTANGYTVEGWYTDAACTNPFDFSTAITSNKTLYAKWTINTYNLNINPHGGKFADNIIAHKKSDTSKPGKGKSKTVKSFTIEDEDIILNTPTRKGYTFNGWKMTDQ